MPNRLLPALLLLAAATLAPAQFVAPASSATSTIKDASALHPPAGVRVAIVEFADLECPACARANPTLVNIVARYGIPLVRHDYLIPSHIWSRRAALFARWLEIQKSGLGEQYRNQVFQNQPLILTYPMLRSFTAQFATDNGLTLPADVDPDGSITAALDADNQLGRQTGIDHTPSIFVVTSGSKGLPYIQVEDVATLAQVLDQALADTAAAK